MYCKVSVAFLLSCLIYTTGGAYILKKEAMTPGKLQVRLTEVTFPAVGDQKGQLQ